MGCDKVFAIGKEKKLISNQCRRVMLNSLVTNFMCWKYLSVPTTFVVRLLSVCTYVVHFYDDHVIMVISTNKLFFKCQYCAGGNAIQTVKKYIFIVWKFVLWYQYGTVKVSTRGATDCTTEKPSVH